MVLRIRNRYLSIINPSVIYPLTYPLDLKIFKEPVFWNMIMVFKNMKAPKNHQFFVGSFMRPAGSSHWRVFFTCIPKLSNFGFGGDSISLGSLQ